MVELEVKGVGVHRCTTMLVKEKGKPVAKLAGTLEGVCIREQTKLIPFVGHHGAQFPHSAGGLVCGVSLAAFIFFVQDYSWLERVN